jgi:hypothetical protein
VIDNETDDLYPEGDDLAELRWHWDSAYIIHCHDDEWTALYRNDLAVLTAASAASLRQLIWDDYNKRKLPPEIFSDDRAQRVSRSDVSRTLLTSAHPALRFTIGTHGIHLARWCRRKRDAVTDHADESQDRPGPPGNEKPSS